MFVSSHSMSSVIHFITDVSKFRGLAHFNFGGHRTPQGPVVQSIVSLTSSLRGQLVKCFTAV